MSPKQRLIRPKSVLVKAGDAAKAKAERALNGLPIDDLPELKFDDLPLAALRANAAKGTEGTGTNEGGVV